jgi:ribosomal protein S7
VHEQFARFEVGGDSRNQPVRVKPGRQIMTFLNLLDRQARAKIFSGSNLFSARL